MVKVNLLAVWRGQKAFRKRPKKAPATFDLIVALIEETGKRTARNFQKTEKETR